MPFFVPYIYSSAQPPAHVPDSTMQNVMNPEVTHLVSFIYDILYSPQNKSTLQVRQPPFATSNFQENTCI
jgi:hypothetical protein